MSEDPAYELAEAHRRISTLVRRGVITAVAGNTARVRLDDDWETDFLPVRQVHAGTRWKSWAAPTVGEQVEVSSLSGEIEAGAVHRGLPCDAHPPPSTDPDLVVLGHGEDGAADTYNLATHAREVTLPAAGRFAVTIGAASLVMLQDQIVLSIGDVKLVITADGVETVGRTKLNGGSRGVVYKGSQDTGGDLNNQAADGVLV